MPTMIFAALSAFGVLSGATFAVVADRFPIHRVPMEGWGGTLLVTGLGVLGWALARFVG